MKYYFIESVNTLSTTGKSRKGALLQAAVSSLEHHVLSSCAVNLLIEQLRVLVDSLNASRKGKPVQLSVDRTAGYIATHPQATGSELYIFQIHYAEILSEIFPGTLFPQISDDLAMRSPAAAQIFLIEWTTAAKPRKEVSDDNA